MIREVPRLPTYFCAWGSQSDMQVAAARALFGDAPITGRLPVTIPGIAPRGAGIQIPAAPRSGAASFSLSPRERDGVRGELKELSP